MLNSEGDLGPRSATINGELLQYAGEREGGGDNRITLYFRSDARHRFNSNLVYTGVCVFITSFYATTSLSLNSDEHAR